MKTVNDLVLRFRPSVLYILCKYIWSLQTGSSVGVYIKIEMLNVQSGYSIIANNTQGSFY